MGSQLKRLLWLGLVLGLIVAGATTAAAQPYTYIPVVPNQGQSLFDSQATSAANTAQSFVCTGAAGQQCIFRGASGSISAAGTCSVTLLDGATTLVGSPGAIPALTSTTPVNLFIQVPASGIAGSIGNAMTLTIGACGGVVTSTVAVQMDRQ